MHIDMVFALVDDDWGCWFFSNSSSNLYKWRHGKQVLKKNKKLLIRLLFITACQLKEQTLEGNDSISFQPWM